MEAFLRQYTRSVIAVVLVAFFVVPADLVAQSHVVTPADLQKKVVAASQARQRDLEAVQHFLSTPAAEKAMKSAQVDPQQVRTAVSTLNDQELARLAARADKAQADFAAGRIEERDLILIILAVVALVLIIVAVR
jgi:hypothetical protein